jgi:ABC-type transport system involved in multi-copper enzyme maturation permease subunit
MFDLRLINAEILKLRRRRGMLAIALLCTVLFAALVFVVTGIQHASNPAKYGPAGGLKTYHDALGTVEMLVLIMATIVGATAGTQDIESGVFRDLVATGRSRMALFGARLTGALAITIPIAAITAVVVGGASIGLADGLPTPDAGALASGTALALGAAALGTAAGVGISALVGSRGPVIGLLLGFFLAIQPLLETMSFLGSARNVVPSSALDAIGDIPRYGVHAGAGMGAAVLAAWIAAALAAGAWRTKAREI